MSYIFGAISPVFIGFADSNLEKSITHISLVTLAGGTGTLLVLIILSVLLNKFWPALKPVLFTLIVLSIVSTTLIIAETSLYMNRISPAGGLVDWHADIEFWACGNELAIRTPQWPNSFIGTSALYEQNDNRIHVEGVPVSLPYDASLGKFMTSIGGAISTQSFILPLNDTSYFVSQAQAASQGGPAIATPGLIRDNIVPGRDGMYAEFTNGQSCGEQPAYLQTFVYKFNSETSTYTQTKLTDPENYEISHQTNVPPGDCLIVEFAPDEVRTNKLCPSYGIHDQKRCDQFGVTADKRAMCTIKEQS